MVTFRDLVVFKFENRGIEDEDEGFISSVSVQDDSFLRSMLAGRLGDGSNISSSSQTSSIFLFLASVPVLLSASQSGVGTSISWGILG